MSLYETQFQNALFLLIIAVADLGFLRGGRANSRGEGGHQHTILPNFLKKLHEIERIWAPRGVRPSRPAYTLYEEHAILTDPKTVLQWLYLIIFFKVQSEFSV